eukprot:2226848-Pleurochrysis_carterae.AAC.1
MRTKGQRIVERSEVTYTAERDKHTEMRTKARQARLDADQGESTLKVRRSLTHQSEANTLRCGPRKQHDIKVKATLHSHISPARGTSRHGSRSIKLARNVMQKGSEATHMPDHAMSTVRHGPKTKGPRPLKCQIETGHGDAWAKDKMAKQNIYKNDVKVQQLQQQNNEFTYATATKTFAAAGVREAAVAGMVCAHGACTCANGACTRAHAVCRHAHAACRRALAACRRALA